MLVLVLDSVAKVNDMESDDNQTIIMIWPSSAQVKDGIGNCFLLASL